MIQNQALLAGVVGLTLAQVIKFVTVLVKHGKIDVRTLVTTGGMPSSHTALVMGLTTTVGILEGVHSTMFDVSLVFAFIVMYDAAGVRQAAGRQARVLNKIVEDLQHSLSFQESHLKELLGHTPREVIGGAILGVAVAFAINALNVVR
ncbi:MAG TPA: divergent PAP2 family protein [Stenomitos sp.]